MAVDLCAICGEAIPFYSAGCDEATAALSEFEVLADRRPAHVVCLDKDPRPLVASMAQVRLFA